MLINYSNRYTKILTSNINVSPRIKLSQQNKLLEEKMKHFDAKSDVKSNPVTKFRFYSLFMPRPTSNLNKTTAMSNKYYKYFK